MESSNSSNRFSLLKEKSDVYNFSVYSNLETQPATKVKVSHLYRQSVAIAHYEMIDGWRKLYIEIEEAFCCGTKIVPRDQIDFEGYPQQRKLTENVQIRIDSSHPRTQIVRKKRVKFHPRSYSEGEEKALEDAVRRVRAEVAAIKKEEEYVSSGKWQSDMKLMESLQLELQAETSVTENTCNTVEPQSGDEYIYCETVTEEFEIEAVRFTHSITFSTPDELFEQWLDANIQTHSQYKYFLHVLKNESKRRSERLFGQLEGRLPQVTVNRINASAASRILAMYFMRWVTKLEVHTHKLNRTLPEGNTRIMISRFYDRYDSISSDEDVQIFLTSWIHRIHILDEIREHLGDRLRPEHKLLFDEHETALALLILTQSGEESDENEGVFDANDVEDRQTHFFRDPEDDDNMSYFSSADSDDADFRARIVSFMDEVKELLADQCNNFSTTDYKIAERVEAIFWFIVYDWPKSTNRKEVVAMLVRLIIRLLGMKRLTDTGKWLLDMFTGSVLPQSGSEVRFDQQLLTNIAKSFITSELYEKIVKFSCALMALAVSGSTKVVLTGSLYEKMWSASKLVVKKGDIVSTVIGFLAWLLKSGYRIMTGELKLQDFFTRSSDMQMFDMRVAKLDYWKSELEAGREDEVTMVSFGIEVTALSQFAAMLNRTAPKQIRLTLANQIRRIDAHWSWYRTKENEKPLRKSPFSILFEGGTSVAKSSMLPYITTMLQHRLGLKVGPEFSYDFNPSDAYMSGFSNMINTIVMDDIGNTMPMFADKASSQTIIDIINNNKKVAVMADLDSKGQYLIKPEIVLGTTNVEQLNAGQTSNCPISILRRWTYCINVTMKPEFSGPGGIRRDDVNPDMERMDVWNLTLYRWVPNDQSHPIKEVIMANASFEVVCRYLLQAADEHNQKQANMVHVTSHLKHVPICECGLMDFVCKLHNHTDPRIARGEVIEGRYTRNHVVPNAGLEWSPAHALNEVFHSKSHKAGLDLLRSYLHTYVRQTGLFLRFMCTLQVMRSETQRNSLWCFLVFVSFNITVMLLYFKAMMLASCGLIVIPALNVIFAVVGVFAYAISIFKRPLYNNLREAIDGVLTSQRCRKTAKLAALIGTIAALYQVRRIWLRSKVSPQGGGGSVPIGERVTRKKELEAQAVGVSNVKDIYREQYIKPMPINIDTKTASADQLCDVIRTKLLYARFLKSRDVEGNATQCVVIPVCSEFLLIPWHVVRDNQKKYVQIMSKDTNHTNASRFFGIEGQWKHVPGTDFALLRSPTIGSQKNIISWFPEGSILDDLRNAINSARIGCRLVWLRGTRDRSVPGLHINLSHGTELVSAKCGLVHVGSVSPHLEYWGGNYMSVIPTYDGMCGSPLVTDRASGPMILGIHSAGATSTTNARFCTIGQTDLRNALKLFECDVVPNSVMHEESDFVKALEFKGTNFEYTTKQCQHATSPYVAGQYDILGYTKEPRRNFKSNVQITMWSEELCEQGMPRKHEAPQLMNSYVPWNMWLTNTSTPSCIDPVVLSLARDDYIQKLQEGIVGPVLEELKSLVKPLPHEVVLAGLDGVKGIDAINRKTSMGIPWCRPKSEFVQPIDIEYPGISVPLGCDRDIMKEIYKMEQTLKDGQRVYVAHRCNLKDEAVKLNKLKVRVFLGSPFPYLFLMRKYFLGVSAFIQRHPYLFETAVGINCYGPEWTKLRKHLTKFGSEKMFAGDYKAFDQKMEIGITKASFEVLLMLCFMAGYTEEEMTICRGLMTETIEGCYNLKGEWIMLFGGNPSGHSLTVVINGIGNAIQMRCPYYALAPQMPPLYHTKVALITYGDDNVGGVSGDIPWYNHTTISDKFAEWGITYTMADKEGHSVPYISIDECSFLKRTWVWNEVRETFDAPLDHDSILKTLHTYVASKVVDIKEQHAELLLSANREYFMYGYDVFEKRREQLSDLAVKYGVVHFLPNSRLPTREELEEWVLDGY